MPTFLILTETNNLFAWRNTRNHVDQFCQLSGFVQTREIRCRTPIGFGIGDGTCTRDSCSRCVYGVHARSEFSDRHDRAASYDRRREQPLRWKSRKGPGNDDAYQRSLTSVLRYIAAGDHQRSLLENNRTSICRDHPNGCIIDHWPLSAASPCTRERLKNRLLYLGGECHVPRIHRHERGVLRFYAWRRTASSGPDGGL